MLDGDGVGVIGAVAVLQAFALTLQQVTAGLGCAGLALAVLERAMVLGLGPVAGRGVKLHGQGRYAAELVVPVGQVSANVGVIFFFDQGVPLPASAGVLQGVGAEVVIDPMIA